MKHQLASIRTENIGVIESSRLGEITRRYKKDTSKPGQESTHSTDPDVLAMCADFMDLLSDGKKTAQGEAEAAERSAARRKAAQEQDWESFMVQVIGMDDNAKTKETGMVPVLNGIESESANFAMDREAPSAVKMALCSEEKFKEYKHHQFVRRWGVVKDSDLEKANEEWYIEEPSVLPEDDPQYLCEMCRHINFKALLEQRGLPGNQAPGPTSIELLGFWKIKEELSCRFCTLLRRSMKGDKLLASELEGDRNRFRLNVLDKGPEHALRLEVELDFELDAVKPRIILQNLDPASTIPLQGLPVESKTAALDRLARWLHICEKEHPKLPDHVQRSLKLGISDLRVIDTEENRVCQIETSAPYCCLSYVWGPPSSDPIMLTTKTKMAMETVGGLVDGAFDLPPTIKDAMEVTRGIGLRYLWVDAFCIIQDDDDDKKNFIPNMDIIYGNATLTIVACTNLSPAEALPGVSAPRQQTQVVEEVQGLNLCAALHDNRTADHGIETSQWNSRAWTFQEKGMAQRVVYFTNAQMSFTCPHGSAVEDTVGFSNKFNGNNLSSTNVINDAIMYQFAIKVWDDRTQEMYAHKSFVFGSGKSAPTLHWRATEPDADENDKFSAVPDALYYCRKADDTYSMGILQQVMNQETLWNLYRKAVKGYTQRNMSVQSDAVNAFAGITHLISQGTNTKFWYGMPDFAFEQALLWVSKEPLSRRRDQNGVALFPSWTWAAWQGHTFYQGKKWNNTDNRPPLSVIEEWLVEQDLEEVLRNFRENGMPEEMYQEQKARMEAASLLLNKTDARDLHHLLIRDSEWKLTHEATTRHIYTHEAYPGVKFDYPISLPGDKVEDRPGKDGTLRFRTRAAHAKLFNMANTSHTQEPLRDTFLQIGLGDINSTHRIVYHQGYRAGVLSLNVTDQDIETTTDSDGDKVPVFIVPISRDSLQEVPKLMSEAFLAWQINDSRLLQTGVLRDEWGPGPGPFKAREKGAKLPFGGHASMEEWVLSSEPMVVFEPNGTVAPDEGVKPVMEDGDPYWDEGRFGEPGYLDVYNVLLIRPTGDGAFERIGAGRMNYNAFHHARPRAANIRLK